MGECIRSLPQPILDVRIPDVFWVSQIARIDQCALNALADLQLPIGDRLRQKPSAELGKVFHSLMAKAVHNAATGMDVSTRELSQWFEDLLEEVRERLEQNPCTAPYADLRQAFLPVAWERKRRVIFDTTIALVSSNTHAPRAHSKATCQKLDYAALRGDGCWSEVPIHAPSLRLSGRLDLVERLGRQITIVDLKTGAACDETGKVRAEIVRQLQLYGAMVKSLDPNATIRLIVNDGTEHSIMFDETVIAEFMKWIHTNVNVLSNSNRISAQEISTIGPGCQRCAFRHRCQKYLKDAPSHWCVDKKWRLPYDIWGIVDQLSPAGNSMYDVSMIDAAGRRIRVCRLHETHLTKDIIGQRVWMYELATSAPYRYGTSWKHPLNFYEYGTSATTDRAWSLEVFI